jgi:gamma-butyrobetaine dioxygenase
LGESVARVGRALAGGSLSHGALYGDVFHVQSIPDAHNLAYTSVPLQPHQDLAYYESMPGLQLLHCLSNQVRRGGESILIDALAAAEEFRKLAPNYFDTLVTCPATFIKQREGADMVYRRPHIVLDDQQAVVVAVNWSPPFEGPLSIAPGHVEDYYRAYAAFSYMLDNSLDKRNVYPGLDPTLVTKLCFYAEEHTWERRLQPGEMLIFNNRRLLHGRRGFELLPHHDDEKDIVGRHLVGCYTNIDETLNQYRLLLRNRPDRGVRVVRNFGNGSIGTF